MGTTAQKLQKALDNKQLIIDKVNNKAGTSFDINSKPSDVANAIENIESGIDTSDATANANDILKGKTAYTTDGKVEGTIETYNGENDVGAVRSLKKLLDHIKTTYYMFSKVYNANSWAYQSLVGYIDYNDTENVVTMANMFYENIPLKEIPLFNTSNNTTMSAMFYSCNNLLNVPAFNTSKVTSMSETFVNCSSLTSIPQFDTSNVIYMGSMCSGCTKLTSIGKLNTIKVTNMAAAFNGCSKLSMIDISYYNISSASNMNNFAKNCYSLKALIIRGFGSSTALNTNSFTGCYHILGTTSSAYNPSGAKDGYIYVPRAMVDTLKSATNWSTYASQIRALEDYTLDGTTTGELNLTAMGLEE